MAVDRSIKRVHSKAAQESHENRAASNTPRPHPSIHMIVHPYG